MISRRPEDLYTAEQSRLVDQCAIREHGLPGPLLMARAARAAFDMLLQCWPSPRCLWVLCGPGNNGGDGLLLALLAQGRGLSVRVFLVDGEPRSNDGRRAAERARAAGLTLELQGLETQIATASTDSVIVDAMLGTGIRGAVRPAYAAAIDAVNASQAPVLALDVPSGLDSDTGMALDRAVRADCTVSFITAKRGLYTASGPDHAGARFLDDLAVPQAAYRAAGEAFPVLKLEDELREFPLRSRAAHKGDFGRCLLIGGDEGMGGAIILATEAALRCGVGLARVGTRAAHLAPLLARRPEAMAVAVDGYKDVEAQLAWASAVVVGPGLGQGPWGQQMLLAALRGGKPLVVDADALNLLASDENARLPPGSIVTPHPAEAARLRGCGTREIQRDRFAAARALATDATVVLKGVGSLVASDDRLAVCIDGNPGMASGGMGDVLSGILGALLAQGMDVADAARLGTVLHARAADRAADQWGEAPLLAADLIDALAGLLP